MPALQHYNQQLIARGGGAPAMPQYQAPQLDDGGARLARHLDDFLRVAGPALGRAYLARETAKVDDAVLETERRFTAVRDEYQREHQGRDAGNAAADLTAAYADIAEETRKNFAAPAHTVFPEMLRQRLEERGLAAAKSALEYQTRQDELWKSGQWQSQLDMFQRMVAADPLDPRISLEARTLKDSLALKQPGQDLRKEFAAIDDIGTRGRLDALLAQRNPQGAEALLNGLGQGGLRADIRGMEPEIEKLVREAGARHGFDADGIELLLAQCMQESGGQRNVVSHAGARGPMQLMPQTAQALGVKNIDDAAQNVDGGVRYMKQMLREFGGNWDDALAAYNMGPNGLRGVKAGRRAMPKETRDYVPRIRSRLTQAGMSAMQPDEMQRYRGRVEALRRQLQAEERERMRLVISNYASASEDGHIMPAPFSEQQVVSVFGEMAPQVLERMNGAHKLALDMEAAGAMSLAEQRQLLQRRQPSGNSMTYEVEARHYEALARNLGAMQKQMAGDPAGFVLDHDQDVARARRAFLQNVTPATGQAYLAGIGAACARRGIEQRIFSKADAAALAGSISSSQNPMQASQTLALALGPAWPKAARELSPGLAPTLRLMVSAGPGASPEPWRLILEAERDRDFEKDIGQRLGWQGTDATDFRQRVHNGLAEFHRTFLAGGDREMPRAIESAVSTLALQYMSRQQMQEKDAVRRATEEVISARYEIAEQGGWWQGRHPAVRIPKSVDVDGVRKGMASFSAQPPIDQIRWDNLPAGYNQELVDAQKRKYLAANAYWICDSDEAGLVLFMHGRAVTDVDGQPLRRTWEELARLGNKPQPVQSGPFSGMR